MDSRANGTTRRCRKAAKRATAPSVAAPRADDCRHGSLRSQPPHDVQACSAEEGGGGRKHLTPRGLKTERAGTYDAQRRQKKRCGGGRDRPSRSELRNRWWSTSSMCWCRRSWKKSSRSPAIEVPQERMDTLVPSVIEEIVADLPQERDHERIAAQTLDIPELRVIMEELSAVVHQERITAQRVDIQCLLSWYSCTSIQIAAHRVDVAVSLARSVAHERVQTANCRCANRADQIGST